MIHLDYRDGRPIYRQIIQGFQEQICSGILLEGDRMPSVRELATELTINPNTIQRAYRELESEGWIASVAGKGSFVCQPPQPDPTALIAEYDALVSKLLTMGVTAQELSQRIPKGGNDHA